MVSRLWDIQILQSNIVLSFSSLEDDILKYPMYLAHNGSLLITTYRKKQKSRSNYSRNIINLFFYVYLDLDLDLDLDSYVLVIIHII